MLVSDVHQHIVHTWNMQGLVFGMHFKLLDLYRGGSLALLDLNANHYGFGGRNSLLLVPQQQPAVRAQIAWTLIGPLAGRCCQASLSAEPHH